jgi:hypothetical protein
MAIYTSSSLSTGKIQLHCEDPNNMSRLHFPPLPFPSCSNSHVTQKPNIVFIQSKKLLILKEYFIFTKKKKNQNNTRIYKIWKLPLVIAKTYITAIIPAPHHWRKNGQSWEEYQ